MLESLDFFIFQRMNNLALKKFWLDVFFIFFAHYFGYILILILFIFLIKNAKKYWFLVVGSIFSCLVARLGITELIRFFFPRPRPFIENHVNLLIHHQPTPAFPSGHAAFYFALSTFVFLYLKRINYSSGGLSLKWWLVSIGFFIASFSVSVSRVFCGVHWPADILMGSLVGIFSGWLIIFISDKFSPNLFKNFPISS